MQVQFNRVEASSDPGDLVLDPFAGSGTTVVACSRTNRSCIAFEIDEKYAKVVEDRLDRKSE